MHRELAEFLRYLEGRISRRKFIVSSWLVVSLTLTILACAGARPGWDSAVEWKAIQTLGHNGDPYAEGIQHQRTFHDRLASSPSAQRSYAYVYSPLTLPMLRLLCGIPFWLLAPIYLGVVVAGYLLQLWAGFQMATESERRWLVVALPFLVFFPGLLNSDTIMSGNTAYPLYGLILCSSVPGWKHGRWRWFYLAVVFASLVKIPFLTLLAFPILVGKRQWLPACGTAMVAGLVYVTQFRLWPGLFREYLVTVRLMFEYEHDFGLSPSGIFGTTMWSIGKSHLPALTVVYLAFASVVGISLLFLAYRVAKCGIAKEAFLPLAIVGTVLLSPRIQEYDVAAITLPMLLVAQRSLRFVWDRNFTRLPSGPAIGAGLGLFLLLNVVARTDGGWKPTELVVLLGIFVLGARALMQDVQEFGGLPLAERVKEDQMVAVGN